MVLLAFLAVECAAQITVIKLPRPMGDAQFDSNSDGVTIIYRDRNWKVDLSRLPIRPDECEDAAAREECARHPGIRCLACVREWQPVAWDETRKIFYLAAGTGTAHNRPWIVLSYNLETRELTRIIDYFGGGFDNKGVVSPLGRYLAYVEYQVCGVCCTTSGLRIVDLQTRRSESFAPASKGDDERVLVNGFHWTAPATLEYEADLRRESDCRKDADSKPRRASGRLDVTQMLKQE